MAPGGCVTHRHQTCLCCSRRLRGFHSCRWAKYTRNLSAKIDQMVEL
ncbi:hypothetical protein Zm00014a_015469 [Zea mays]|uniref:Uncharacterized protein n=2 Tax=Zea mays TaxID=4577 RepID=A0A3L6FV54_MAIZE|nr:hypothetical protein Zm00014a_015469 [Zea mays]PWZ38352.1 hypothetical protein Zm00014a_015469 [Zea mays]